MITSKLKEQLKRMEIKMGMYNISILLLVISFAWIARAADFNINRYGAKPNSDITKVNFCLVKLLLVENAVCLVVCNI